MVIALTGILKEIRIFVGKLYFILALVTANPFEIDFFLIAKKKRKKLVLLIKLVKIWVIFHVKNISKSGVCEGWYGMVWYGMVDVCDGYLTADPGCGSPPQGAAHSGFGNRFILVF